MRAAEVLDHKQDLLVRLENPLLRNGWRDQTAADMGVGLHSYLTPEQVRSNAAAVTNTLRANLPEAEAFHVSEEMSTLVQFAATQLDETDRVNRLMLPSASGIARFEGGLDYLDVRGKKLRISWMVWGPLLATTALADRPGGRLTDVGEPEEWTGLWLFNDQIDEPDDIAQAMFRDASFGPDPEAALRKVFGRWGYIGVEVATDQMRLGPAWRTPDGRKVAEVLADGDVPQEYTNPIRLAHAFWLLLGQTVSTATEAHLDRPARKRAGRAGIPPRVTIVQLRNLETRRAEGESLVEWSHRWAVRGHPAWRACGPNHPLAEEYPGQPGLFRCRVWIAPYVKGPADAPLIISEHVYALHR